ncbi:MAG: alpha-amylase family glycosyl hydrolase [Anaerolineales bacterium]
MKPRYPSIYQINTRIWLGSLSAKYGRQISLVNVPDEELERIAALGFDWLWLLGVWRTSEIGRQIALELPEMRQVYQEALPDYQPEDICSSPFANTGYVVSLDLGGEHGLALLRERLQARNIRLLLDYIPNHTARDHPWLTLHPDFYIHGSEEQLRSQPYNYGFAQNLDKVFAFGRDPFFQGWSDTFQLNYGNPQLQEVMRKELLHIAGMCDGVRCDMAMLVLPEVFENTWGIEMQPFWAQTIQETRTGYPEFIFMAEVYWDLEWSLQEQGFDYTYDKRLYDRLLAQEARPVREHLLAGLGFQSKLVRFLENHDEVRAAAALPPKVHRAAAVITYLTPGMRFFHQGQLVGNRTRLPMQLCRSPREHPDPYIWALYSALVELLNQPVLRNGNWQLLECWPAWQSNWTWDSFVAFSWQDEQQTPIVVVVNYSPHQSQCYVRLPWNDLSGKQINFKDQLGETDYIRSGDDLDLIGLYLDMPPWESHVFKVSVG